MSKSEEKLIYRVVAQKEGITITAETLEVTFEEAKNSAVADVLMGTDKAIEYQPFVVLPITTRERWEEKAINFCPRCGASIHEYELDQDAEFDCYECDSSIEVHIF